MNNLTFNSTDFLATLDVISSQGTAVFTPVRHGQELVDFRCSMMSSNFKQLFGFQFYEGSSHSITQFTLPAEEQELLEHVKHALTTKKQIHCQNTLIQVVTDQPQRCNLTLTPVQDHVLLTVSPVTPTNQLPERDGQLQILENSFNACLNGITVYEALFEDDHEPTDFRFVAINEAGLSMSGLSREQVIGKTLRELYPPTESFGLFATYKRVYLTGQPYHGEHFYTDHGVWRQLIIVRISGGIMVTYQDITLQKNLQREQQQLIDQLITHANSGALLVMPIMIDGQLTDLQLVRCNETYAQLWGKSPEQLCGQLLSHVEPDWQSTTLFGHIRQVLLTGEPYQGRGSHVIDNTVRYITFQLAMVGNSVLLTYQDLTQLHRDQNHIKQLVQDLERASHIQQEFAFIASHDLQEPLRKIQQFSGLLVDQYGHQLGEGAEYLERVRGSAKRMSDLLKELLNYSRLSTRLQPFEPVSLSTVVAEAVRGLTELIQESSAKITVDPLPEVSGDVSQLELLFHHLLTNSIKFVNPGESPRIRIVYEPVTLNQLPIRLQVRNSIVDYHCIQVIDSGVGFEQKYADRIFGVFQRLHGRHMYRGMGIGLAMCQRIVENHKGDIEAKSELNKGSVFSIFLPRRK
jgi:PAS domain S-box-containing protein